MRRVPLATFHEVEPAQQLRSRLQQAGIDALVHDDSRLQRLWFISQPLASIHIEVPQPDYLRARHLVEDCQEAEGVPNKALCFPPTPSARVQYPQLTPK